MELEGKFTVKAPIEKLWDFLLKPETLAACIPGAESIQKVDDKTYDCVIKQKVGPISVKFKFKTWITKEERPHHIEFEGEGDDIKKAGHFVQKSSIDFKDLGNGEVEVSYKTQVNMVGKLAMFGDRILKAKAKKVEREFTKNLQEKLKEVS